MWTAWHLLSGGKTVLVLKGGGGGVLKISRKETWLPWPAVNQHLLLLKCRALLCLPSPLKSFSLSISKPVLNPGQRRWRSPLHWGRPGGRVRGGGWSAQSLSPRLPADRSLEEQGVQSPCQAPQKRLPMVPLVSLELWTKRMRVSDEGRR